MSTIIGNLRVVLGLDAAAFQRGLSDATKGLGKIGRDMAAAGRTMSMAITAPVAGFGALALKSAGDFEAAMNRVRAATGATAAEMEGLEGIALKMGETTQFKATEAAGAIEMLAKNGLNASQILGGALEASMLLAASSGADLASAGDVATDVMLQFGKRAGDMTGLVDGMTGVLLASKFGFDDYRLAIAQAGGVAGGLGVTFEDFNAAIAGTSQLFASGSDAGTSFKTFLQRLVPASGPAAEAMRELNLQFFEADGSMKSMADVAEELREGLSGLSDEARNDALSTIFGTDALRTAIGLAEQGADGIERLKTTIGEASATEQAEARLAGFNGEMLKLRSAVEGLMIAIANSGIIQWATAFAQQMTQLVLRLKETNPEILKWGVVMAGLAAAIGPVVAGLGLMLIGMGPLLTGLGLLASAVGAVASPFALVAAGAAAAAAAIYANWGSVGPWFNSLIESLKQMAAGFGQAIVGVMTADMASAVEGLKAVWQGWSDYWETVWTGVVGVIRWAWSAIEPIMASLGATEAIISAWQSVKAALDEILAGIARAFQSAWEKIEPVVNAISSVQNRLNGSRDGPISGASGPYTGGATGPVLPGTSIPQGMEGVVGEMGNLGDAAAGEFEGRFNKRMGIKSPSRVMEEAGRYIMQGLEGGLAGYQPQVEAQADSIGEYLQSSIKTHLNGTVQNFQDFKDRVLAVLQDLMSELITRGIASLFDPLSGALRGAGVGVPFFASGGMHSGGWRIVGERGPELEATGPARYLSARQTSDILQGGGSQKMEVHIHENAAEGAHRVQQSPGRIDVMLRKQLGEMVRGGGLDGAMGQRFGVRPRAAGA